MASTRGTLAWSPAAAHADLLAPAVADAIGATPSAQVAAIDPDLADTAAFCAAYDVAPEVSANCVVVVGRRGEVQTYAAIMVLATMRADVNGIARKHLGVRKISFAPMAEAVSLTAMEYGGITPIGLPDGWPVLVDRAVLDAGQVVIGSGRRGSKILLEATDLLSLAGAEGLSLAIPRGEVPRATS